LIEQLIILWFPSLPILLLRPTSIGPAITQSYKIYGPQGLCPISILYIRLMQPIEGKRIRYAPTYSSNILNKIRLDLVVNILLQYAYLGSYGVIHASSSYYIPKTLE
ncbi:uncharacterized protein K444DRAFT_529575, partial [Hyaloscypha bicolor E]